MAIVDFAGYGYKGGAIDFTDYDIVTVTSLPQAGEDTMGHIYQVGPDASNNYDRYYTQKSGDTYSWVPMGSTQMNLSDYATESEVSQLQQKVDNYSDADFRLMQMDLNNIPNLADFDSFTDDDVTYKDTGLTVSFADNVITCTRASGGGVKQFSVDLSKLGLTEGEKYLITVKRIGGTNNSVRIFILRGSTSESVGNRVVQFTKDTNYFYTEYTADKDRFLAFEQGNSETGVDYTITIFRVIDIEKLRSEADIFSPIVEYDSMLLSDGLGLDDNAADFTGYSDTNIIFNPNSVTAEFAGNKITARNPGGNSYLGISLDGLQFENGEDYIIRLFCTTDNAVPTYFGIYKNTTSSFIGEKVASFVASAAGRYYTVKFKATSGLVLMTYQGYKITKSVYTIFACKEYGVPIGITEKKERENFANKMDWVALDGSSPGVSAIKGEDGAVVSASGSGNSIGVFALPQLPGGHSYTFRIECSTLLSSGTQAIKNAVGGANRYVFTVDGDVYTLTINNYEEYIYPLNLWLLLKYNITTHNIKFYITDNGEPQEKTVVKDSTLVGIDEGNFSEELLNRCDFLENNPTLYKGMDICAFNKGICIGDSLTAGSMNTTDAQGNDGPALQTLRGSSFTLARSYPAKLAKLTGIDITTVAQGGITSYDFYETFKDQDWSGHEFAIIELGRNDVAQPPVGYGSWTEQSVTGFTNIINKLKTENPGIKIFVCNNTNIVGNKELWDLINGIEQLVSDLNDPDVILLDMHKYGRLNSTNAYQCGHLTQYGYYRLAQDYCNYISWYMAMHKEEFRFIQFIGTNYVYTKEF